MVFELKKLNNCPNTSVGYTKFDDSSVIYAGHDWEMN